ncbi:hypothetical protein [Streptomyces sp. NPDC014894]|uniref:hypothetical protein n=1 Tax=Streptomyces sp. NPDC014894 TaxID=3364931 RepID=UPI0036F830F5
MKRPVERIGGWVAGFALLAGIVVVGQSDFMDTDKTPERVENGVGELRLSVTGRPTPGSLAAAEQVLAKISAGDADGLVDLAEGDPGEAEEAVARAWVKDWRDATTGPMTAEFSEPEKGVSVDVAFEGRGVFSFGLTPAEDEDRYEVFLTED